MLSAAYLRNLEKYEYNRPKKSEFPSRCISSVIEFGFCQYVLPLTHGTCNMPNIFKNTFSIRMNDFI